MVALRGRNGYDATGNNIAAAKAFQSDLDARTASPSTSPMFPNSQGRARAVFSDERMGKFTPVVAQTSSAFSDFVRRAVPVKPVCAYRE
jgi:hypothetical protein